MDRKLHPLKMGLFQMALPPLSQYRRYMTMTKAMRWDQVWGRMCKNISWEWNEWKCFCCLRRDLNQSCDLLCSVRREQRPTESRPIGGHDVTLSEGAGMRSSSHAPGRLWSGDQAETGWRGGGGEDEKRLVVSYSFQIFTLLWWVFMQEESSRFISYSWI